MIEITKIIEFDMGHRVPNHKSKCRNPHGHRYRMELTVRGRLVAQNGASSEGMIIDFADVKRHMMERVHDVVDHGFMVYEKDQVMRQFFDGNADRDFRFIVVPFVPTAENISQWCYEQLAPCFPPDIDIVRVRIYESPNSWADYCPAPE